MLACLAGRVAIGPRGSTQSAVGSSSAQATVWAPVAIIHPYLLCSYLSLRISFPIPLSLIDRPSQLPQAGQKLRTTETPSRVMTRTCLFVTLLCDFTIVRSHLLAWTRIKTWVGTKTLAGLWSVKSSGHDEAALATIPKPFLSS